MLPFPNLEIKIVYRYLLKKYKQSYAIGTKSSMFVLKSKTHESTLTVPSRSILKKWMSRGTVPIRGLSRQVGLQICKPILMEHMSHCRKFLQ